MSIGLRMGKRKHIHITGLIWIVCISSMHSFQLWRAMIFDCVGSLPEYSHIVFQRQTLIIGKFDTIWRSFLEREDAATT